MNRVPTVSIHTTNLLERRWYTTRWSGPDRLRIGAGKRSDSFQSFLFLFVLVGCLARELELSIDDASPDYEEWYED